MVHAKHISEGFRRIKVCYIGIKAGAIFKRKMADLEANASVTPKMENALENSISIENLILETEELKKEKERNQMKLAILEANIVKHVDPEKLKERGRIQIQTWLGVMENYLHVGNTSPEFWVDIAQTYLEIRVAKNWHNTINIVKHVDPEKLKERGRVRIQTWLGVMENYLHVGNTSPKFWVDIAQTYLEIRVAKNWHNTM